MNKFSRISIIFLGLPIGACQTPLKTANIPADEITANRQAAAVTSEPLSVSRAGRTGTLQHSELNEISGMSASSYFPGVLYAVNDSGNSPRLYALDEQGQLLNFWTLAVRNRDWEDMTRVSHAGKHYLVVGDTGDNLRVKPCSALHFFPEPSISTARTEIHPSSTLQICFEDGPRNIEAFSIIDDALYLLSKEPVSRTGRTPSGVYRVKLPDEAPLFQGESKFVAKRVAQMPLRSANLEASLAATLAGVDLSHPTSMEFDATSNSAYILTYREVLRVQKADGQSWADAFTKPAERVMSHNLSQAEALTISPGRAVWFTSENLPAPLWAIPLAPPL